MLSDILSVSLGFFDNKKKYRISADWSFMRSLWSVWSKSHFQQSAWLCRLRLWSCLVFFSSVRGRIRSNASSLFLPTLLKVQPSCLNKLYWKCQWTKSTLSVSLEVIHYGRQWWNITKYIYSSNYLYLYYILFYFILLLHYISEGNIVLFSQLHVSDSFTYFAV